MRGRDRQDEELEEFIAARTQDLHHDAYQLTAAQEPAERLVVAVLADMRRERVEVAQAGGEARLRMARVAVRHDTPTEITDVSQLPAEFQVLARLSPRQRAVLLLQVADHYDDRETARALRMTTRTVTETVRSIPYDELPGASPHSGELRSLLDDFGDRGTAPSAATTLDDVRAVPPPPRRPWWTYVAALLVIALTVATLVVTQGWHNDWLRSPEGLNHTHGTHFPAYTRGYKLVDIREIEPGPPGEFSAGSADAVTMNCADLAPGLATVISSGLDSGTHMMSSCSGQTRQVELTPVAGNALVSVNDFSRDSWPIAVYRQVPLSEYPVATQPFDVQKNDTIDELRSVTATDGNELRPQTKGTVLTLRGPSDHPNGTFKGTLKLPPGADGSHLNIVGLLSPTATGRYLVRIDHRVPWTSCGNQRRVTYQEAQRSAGCSLVDHRIPQVEFQQVGEPSANARTMPVEIIVKDARGPWTLQVVADRYKADAGTN